jgi:Lrp/AsnC family leucine-responsive transcriptional regulator
MVEYNLDKADRRLLNAIQQDGRMTIVELSEQVGLSQTPCLRRLRKLEADGVITGYNARIDQDKVGLPVNVFVAVNLEKQMREHLDRFERNIAEFEEVMECYMMSGGGRDYLLRVVSRDIAHYERFLKTKLSRVPGIANLDTSFALNTVIQRSQLPLSVLPY